MSHTNGISTRFFKKENLFLMAKCMSNNFYNKWQPKYVSDDLGSRDYGAENVDEVN